MDETPDTKTRQEEAYDYVSGIFIKLLQNDDRISYEHKRSVIAFWEDLFAHEGVKNNMLQAFSNFLDEIDGKMDAARKAGISQLNDAITKSLPLAQEGTVEWAIVKATQRMANELLAAEDTPEEPALTNDEIENMDLSEVGGGDEDETPLI